MNKFFISIIFLLFSCTQEQTKETDAESTPLTFREIEFTGENASVPNLTSGPDGKVYLSWIEKADDLSTLKYSVLENNTWSSANVIASGDNWFVNWADFPSLLALESGLAAHFLAYNGDGRYAYGVNLASSKKGESWSKPMVAHDDNSPTEHGFVTLLSMDEDKYMAIWLDGRKYADAEAESNPALKEMTLRSGIFDLEGNKLEEDIIDPRTCDCCQTDGVISSKGPVVVYRDRGMMEVRDIFISRFENGEWKEPWIVHPDDWEIPGCPVNGPAIDASGNELSVAWFTAAKGTPKVLVAFSEDDGDHFAEPVRVDLGNPLGRVDIKQLSDFSVVTWMEEKDEVAFIYCRKIMKDGSMEEPVIINETKSSRSSGFPRMVRNEESLIFAWTVPGEVSTIKTVTTEF